MIKTIVTIFFVMALLTGCSGGDDIKSTAESDSTEVVIRPDQILKDTRITLYNGALKTTDLIADSIEKYEANDSSLAWNLKVHFFDSTGKEISYLEADSGLVREKTNSMEVFGHVIVISQDSAKLFTEQLKYDVLTDSITTDKFVKIVQRGDTIKGYGLVADQRLNKTRILKQVTGTLQNTGQVLD